MLEMERQNIVEFLRSTDPEMEINSGSSIQECIELLMDKISDMELDYSILSTAFVNGVNPDRFEEFHRQVMLQYDQVRDGEEIPEHVLDRISSQYR